MRQLDLIAVAVKENFKKALELSVTKMNQSVPCFLGSENHQDQVIYLINQFVLDWGGLNRFSCWSEDSNEMRQKMVELKMKLQRNMETAVMFSGGKTVIPQEIFLGSAKQIQELCEIPKKIGITSQRISQRKIKDSNYKIAR